MDIRMPDMNGLDATRIIKEVNTDIPIVALSAYAFDENIREAKEAGCDEFLAKPFRVEDLLDLVQKYVKE
jgi:CheY-like chemotaxis protein